MLNRDKILSSERLICRNGTATTYFYRAIIHTYLEDKDICLYDNGGRVRLCDFLDQFFDDELIYLYRAIRDGNGTECTELNNLRRHSQRRRQTNLISGISW